MKKKILYIIYFEKNICDVDIRMSSCIVKGGVFGVSFHPFQYEWGIMKNNWFWSNCLFVFMAPTLCSF